MLQLYTYFRSSAAYRVRIALALKGLAYESLPIHLLHDGGQQFTSAYRATNPQALVPSLQTDAGVLTQSLAMKPSPWPAVMRDSKPRPLIVSANVPCVSSQARTQRLQTMHLLGS